MKHKVSELIGEQLDCAVALCRGYEWHTVPPDRDGKNGGQRVMLPRGLLESGWDWPKMGPVELVAPRYSLEWIHGGPIIERERIELQRHACSDGWWAGIRQSIEQNKAGGVVSTGPTALIAAMRAYVASEYGDEIDIESPPNLPGNEKRP